jgi:hypothetical protein
MASPTAGDAPLAAPAPAADATDAALAAAAAVPDPDAEFGFQRPELGKEKLVGTVGFHERHVFLCYKGPDVWPSHLEAAESDRLPRLLAAAIKARKPNLKKTVSIHMPPSDFCSAPKLAGSVPRCGFWYAFGWVFSS